MWCGGKYFAVNISSDGWKVFKMSKIPPDLNSLWCCEGGEMKYYLTKKEPTVSRASNCKRSFICTKLRIK